MSGAIDIDRLTVRHGGVAALRDVTLRVEPGTTLAVIGPNGSGKTTLLHAIAGIVEPTSGSVRVDRSKVALVLQATDVDASLPLTCAAVVAMGRYPHRGRFGRFHPHDRAAVATAMDRVGVSDLAEVTFHNLSGGQRQRVLLAQALAQEPAIHLLDEPMNGLDVAVRHQVLEVIEAERSAGRTVVVSTHDLDDASRFDGVALLSGSMMAYGPPDEVLTEAHLRQAFGGRVIRLPSGGLLMDDPHHDHAH